MLHKKNNHEEIKKLAIKYAETTTNFYEVDYHCGEKPLKSDKDLWEKLKKEMNEAEKNLKDACRNLAEKNYIN